MKHYFLLFILITVVGTSVAQIPGDPFFMPKDKHRGKEDSARHVNFAFSDAFTHINTDAADFSMQQLDVNADAPLYKKTDMPHPVMALAGVHYQGLLLSGEPDIPSNSFHSLSAYGFYSYGVSANTTLSFLLSGSVGSDFKNSIDGNDIMYVAGMRLGLHQSYDFKYGVTLVYTNNYAEQLLLPIPDFDWTINNKWHLSGLLPLKLDYRLSESQSLSFNIKMNNGLYRLYTNTGQEEYLQMQQVNAGFAYSVNIGRRVKINLSLMHAMSQRLETFTADQKMSLDAFRKLSDRTADVSYNQRSVVFSGGISIRL